MKYANERRAAMMGRTLLFCLVILFFCSCPLIVDTTPAAYAGVIWSPGTEALRYRGANITCADETSLTADDFARWKSWGINLIRINFNKDDLLDIASNPPAATDPWQPYVKNRAKLNSWLGWCNDNQIEVMIALDHLWGDDHDFGSMWWFGGYNDYLNHRIKLAQAMADWVGTSWPLVRWIEPWNEPHPYDALYKTYFLDASIAAIREKNSAITIVCMAPADWGGVKGFEGWNGVSDSKVAYSSHFYDPMTYTHQGVHGMPRLAGAGWPGSFKLFADSTAAVYCDRSAYAAFNAELAAMHDRTGKRVFVSEFGVLRWAVDNDKYLSDVISVFEEKGYDWILHSIAGWNGWNPSFGASDVDSNQTFGDMKSRAFGVMQAAWAKNP